MLEKIWSEASIIADFINDCTCEIFIEDEKIKRAVCMTLINIGELVKLVSDELKQSNSSVPWRSIAGLRDVAAHGYMTLRMEDIWETVSEDLPTLKKQIEKLLKI